MTFERFPISYPSRLSHINTPIIAKHEVPSVLKGHQVRDSIK